MLVGCGVRFRQLRGIPSRTCVGGRSVLTAVFAAVRGTGFMEYRSGGRPHSALMLRARMTLPHFSVSSAMSFPNAAGA